MEEKRRIVIPIGAKPETPQFDAEETLMSARPVVPLSAGETAGGAKARPSFYRSFPFLALIVIAATAVGLAGGLGIARYRYQQGNTAAAPVATQPIPPPTDTRTATVTPPKENTREGEPESPQLPDVKLGEKTGDDPQAKDDEAGKSQDVTKAPEDSAEKGSNGAKADDRTTKPGARNRNRGDDTAEDEDRPTASRRERRQQDNRNDDTLDVPRQIERASERINRIREIFEGRPVRP
jgi:hypothetical protein